MITRLVLFHESGIPIYSWPQDDETISIFTSFISALQQFIETYMKQSISLVGLEKENVILKKYGEYLLAVSFVDTSATQLINDIAEKFFKQILTAIVGSDLEDLQFNADKIGKYIEENLKELGVLWLIKVAEYIYKTNSVVSVAIFTNSSAAKPLYIPLEPLIGFNKLVEAISSFPRIKNIIQATIGRPKKIQIFSRNRLGLEYWLCDSYVAVFEHHYENPPIVENERLFVPEKGNKRILYNTFASFALNILSDQPEFVLIENSKGECILVSYETYEFPRVEATRAIEGVEM